MNNYINNYSIMSYIESQIARKIESLNSRSQKQNTDEWALARRYSVGCSEISDACGTICMRKSLIQKKLNPKQLNHVPAIMWGNVFESSARIVSSLIFNTEIYEFNGGIKHPNGINTCSPDGVGVLKVPIHINERILGREMKNFSMKEYSKKKGDILRMNRNACIPAIVVQTTYADSADWAPTELGEHNYSDEIELVTLFEFKCPYNREMNHSEIIENYLCQILGGIDIMRITMFGVLCECWFNRIEVFIDTPRVIYDPHRQTQNTIYFGGLKFINVFAEECITLSEFDFRHIRGKKLVEEYEIVDGPYIFIFGSTFRFVANGFPADSEPTNICEFNHYCDELLETMQPGNLNYYIKFELEKMSTKYVPRIDDFITEVEPYCKSIIAEVQAS